MAPAFFYLTKSKLNYSLVCVVYNFSIEKRTAITSLAHIQVLVRGSLARLFLAKRQPLFIFLLVVSPRSSPSYHLFLSKSKLKHRVNLRLSFCSTARLFLLNLEAPTHAKQDEVLLSAKLRSRERTCSQRAGSSLLCFREENRQEDLISLENRKNLALTGSHNKLCKLSLTRKLTFS